jgi:hypothetical protein
MKAQEKAQAMLSDDKVRKEREAHERADKEKQVVIREGAEVEMDKEVESEYGTSFEDDLERKARKPRKIVRKRKGGVA